MSVHQGWIFPVFAPVDSVDRISQSILPEMSLAKTDAALAGAYRERYLARLASLSRREREIFQALVRGERNADIAIRLQLSHKSVSTYRTRLLEKLGVANNAQLVSLSSQVGLGIEQPFGET